MRCFAAGDWRPALQGFAGIKLAFGTGQGHPGIHEVTVTSHSTCYKILVKPYMPDLKP